MTEQLKQSKLNYGRFVLVMLVVTWAVRQLVGETWLAVAVALAVNVLISWPRRPKGGGETGEARPEGEVRAWSDPKPELEPKPGREIRSLADLKAADTTFAAEARKAWRRGREEGRREREARKRDGDDSTPRPPVLHSRGRGHRCEGCGARGEVWTVTQVGVSAPIDSASQVKSNRASFRLTWRCHPCGHTDVEYQPNQLPGVPVSDLVG